LVDHPTTSGNVVRADHERDGSIRSGRTTESPRRICGGVRQIVVTEEQRYGPRWLRVNDDDEYLSLPRSNMRTASAKYGISRRFTMKPGVSCT